MILQGFDIENWSCIKRVSVADLPPSGIIVLHGPNGTGKTSIVAALRACLMDFPSGSLSKELKRWFPKNGTEKPRVSVTFRARGYSWRISKQFGSKESKLERLTAAGTWKLEKATAADAHEESRKLVGDTNSDAGLHQLLWLSQAEIRLPDPKDFDTDVQSQLRTVLGVLQTPLDDCFLARVKKEWSRWYGARSKPGEKPKLKKDCALDKALVLLSQQTAELSDIEEKHKEDEKRMERSGDLEVVKRDLRRQQAEQTRQRDLLQQEYENSLKRLEAHQLAAERVRQAEKIRKDQHDARQERALLEQRLHEAERSAETARVDVEETGRRLQVAEHEMRELRRAFHATAAKRQELQTRQNELGALRQSLALKDQMETFQGNLQRAEQVCVELDELKRQAHACAAPDDATILMLETNRRKADQSRAELEAAAIVLTLMPEPGAAAPLLAIDGAPDAEAGPPADGSPITRSVRRRAQIRIPGWGRAELSRGSDARTLDQIEADLRDLDRAFAEGIADFGVTPGDPTALDRLRRLAADKKLRDPELKRRQQELDHLAPQGLDALRSQIARLETLLQAGQSGAGARSQRAGTVMDAADLERLATQRKREIEANETEIAVRQREIRELEIEIDGNADAVGASAARNDRAEPHATAAAGLRHQAVAAKERLASFRATADAVRDQLSRMSSAERIEDSVREADRALQTARLELDAAALSEGELTIRDRLDTAKEGLQATEGRLAEAEREFHQIEAVLRLSEGLHQKRAAAATRVEELHRRVERESLERDAYDRLYGLFEECREKQLGAVMAPIEDRVLRWMRLVRIPDYQSIRFNDKFLPDQLIARDLTTELMLEEESTGTIEQIALMVRLALGSVLSTQAEPVVAVLDDPLTHSDVVRLDRMRAVLKNASAGDTGTVPPAGPLQIVVFTCHPEWFALDGAKLIDLSQENVMSRR
jgi:energy-coupling factor transporter ATP-binding protein EcfA2